MSDTEKDRPETPTPKEGNPEAKSSGGAVVISIEQARAELLAKPRQRATPQMGVARQPRPRAREVPAPVTLPPGEHAAVIVTDTPAARAHVDKKTVHPGEMPAQTHEKKVRVKTSLDPRRMKTQLTDRRASPEAQAEAASAETPAAEEHDAQGLWNRPSPPPASVPPRSSRPSLTRARAISHDKPSVPLFVIGVVLAAALGATVVFLLSRSGAQDPAAPTATTQAAGPLAPGSVVTAQGGPASPPATGAPSTPATADTAPSAPATTAPQVTASAPPVVKTAAPTVKPSAAPSTAPTATAKPTATSVLPFGVGHD